MAKFGTFIHNLLSGISPKTKAQIGRLVRIAIFAVGPQLLAAAADPRSLTWKTLGAIATGALEAAYRAAVPAPDPSPAKFVTRLEHQVALQRAKKPGK